MSTSVQSNFWHFQLILLNNYRVVIGNVPDERTVVGIPAKVVRTRRSDNPNPHGVDLDHHLMPDPVAGAITCLLEHGVTAKALAAYD